MSIPVIDRILRNAIPRDAHIQPYAALNALSVKHHRYAAALLKVLKTDVTVGVVSTMLAVPFTFPAGTVTVVDTTNFPASGAFRINSSNGSQLVTYTGKTPTQFTGCTGGSGSCFVEPPGITSQFAVAYGPIAFVRDAAAASSNDNAKQIAAILTMVLRLYNTPNSKATADAKKQQFVTAFKRRSAVVVTCLNSVALRSSWSWHTPPLLPLPPRGYSPPQPPLSSD